MNKITLDTPISRIVMTDKLRTRLRMLKCNTFRDAMEADPSEWEHVAAKVVNAMKRFKQEYSDVYTHLLEHPGDAVRSGAGNGPAQRDYDVCDNHFTPGLSDEERRFFVANNLLNAYVAAGFITVDEHSLDSKMCMIVSQADAFMRAYDNAQLKVDSLASNDVAEEMNTYGANTQESDKSEGYASSGEEIPDGSLKIGDVVKLTVYHGRRSPIGRKFQVGDVVDVTDVTYRRDGTVTALGVMGDKVASFDSQRYSWDVIGNKQAAHNQIKIKK